MVSTIDFPGLEEATELDTRDPLARFRDEFVIDDPTLLYMDGNSLGRLPIRSQKRLAQVVEKEWGSRLIRSWGESWYAAPSLLGEKIGQIIGAASGEVVVCDSTSVNLFKLTLAALSLCPGRNKIISDAFNFPSDLYVLQGCIQLLGNRHQLHIVQSEDGIHIDPNHLFEAIDEDTALLVLSQVAFKSGYLFDAETITRQAHSAGALVLWDLSHSAGVVPVELKQWEADFAIGCTYKYLNGGPGSPAYLYIRSDLHEKITSPIWGWFGERKPFAFDLDYHPALGVTRFQAGTPPILSMLAVDAGLDLVLEAGIEPIRLKSILLTEYLLGLFDKWLAPLGFTLGSPRDPALRGSHISFRHPQAYQINQALIETAKVIPDFREPDNIRLGLAPLYTTFEDVYNTISRIQRIVLKKEHETYSTRRQAVT